MLFQNRHPNGKGRPGELLFFSIHRNYTKRAETHAARETVGREKCSRPRLVSHNRLGHSATALELTGAHDRRD